MLHVSAHVSRTKINVTQAHTYTDTHTQAETHTHSHLYIGYSILTLWMHLCIYRYINAYMCVCGFAQCWYIQYEQWGLTVWHHFPIDMNGWISLFIFSSHLRGFTYMSLPVCLVMQWYIQQHVCHYSMFACTVYEKMYSVFMFLLHLCVCV